MGALQKMTAEQRRKKYREYQKTYYERHRDKAIAYQRDYSLAHRKYKMTNKGREVLPERVIGPNEPLKRYDLQHSSTEKFLDNVEKILSYKREFVG
jgi:hypothetical protein